MITHGICNLTVVPLRKEPTHQSEMVSQVLFGEHFEVLEKSGDWFRVVLAFDLYQGWIQSSQFIGIDFDEFTSLNNEPCCVSFDIVQLMFFDDTVFNIVLGSSLPHFKEMQLPVVSELTRRFGDEVRLIDMTGDLFKVVEDILSCRRIFSSSLHGLVLADAYEIPSCRLILSDLIIGGNFKYDDYYSGIGISDYPRHQMTTVPKSVKELYSMPICHRKSFDGDLLKQVLTEYLNP